MPSFLSGLSSLLRSWTASPKDSSKSSGTSSSSVPLVPVLSSKRSSAPTKLQKQLERDEGKVAYAYQDSLGYWTIGIGHLIDHRKGGFIPDEVITILFDLDRANVDAALEANLPWVKNLDEARRGVLQNMCFQMGIGGLLKFKNTLALIKAGEYDKAADGMANSLWAKQTPSRSRRLQKQMRTGEWQ